MAGLTDTAKNLRLDELATHATTPAAYLSLHTADPGTGGTSEVTGGSPAYARQSATWGAASGGVLTLSADATFDVPGGTTVTHYGIWSAASGGTFLGGGALDASEAFAGQGEYVLRAGSTVTLT